MKRLFAALILCASVAFAQVDATTGTVPNTAAPASAEAPVASASTIRTPLFAGAALGFGSGTGVGNERGLGLRQIEPMIGLWYPGIGFLRVGYGFFEYSEKPDEGENMDIEHSDFDIEIGAHLLSQLYLTGAFSRSKELSDLGDVAWNEWALGFGSIVNLFGKAMLFAEITYRWVRDHYDPFLDKNVSGSRLQFNIGFATYLI